MGTTDGTKLTLTAAYQTVYDVSTAGNSLIRGFMARGAGADIRVKVTFKSGRTSEQYYQDGVSEPFPARQPLEKFGITKVEIKNADGAATGVAYFNPWID